MSKWIKLTDAVMNEMEGLYWLATRGGDVVVGEHDWVQGRNPDRFVSYGSVYFPEDITHVMKFTPPKHPLKDAQ